MGVDENTIDLRVFVFILLLFEPSVFTIFLILTLLVSSLKPISAREIALVIIFVVVDPDEDGETG